MGEQTLCLYPDPLLTAEAPAVQPEFRILDPARYFKGIGHCARVQPGETFSISHEIEGSEHDMPADYVFLSIGFTGHDTPAVFDRLGVDMNRGVVKSDYGKFSTNIDNVFAAGDVRRGASLIVWAIAEGRGAARAIDEYLMGESTLPAPDMKTQLASSAG